MTRSFRSPAVMAAILLVLASALLGWLRPVDDLLRNYRFSAATTPATDSIVLVDIDAQSIADIGVWPWPRHVHADIIDALLAADVTDIFLDIDFSSPSTPAEDAALEAALERAGGYVKLTAFVHGGDSESALGGVMPFERFAAHAQTVFVNVPVDPDGIVRRYARGFEWNGETLPTAGVALSGEVNPPEQAFAIDFGINAESIRHLSVSALLNGDFDVQDLAGRQVVVGATALELRDNLTVPRYGTLPGVLIHVLAAETLRQHRVLREPGPAASVLVALALSAILAVLLNRGYLLAAAGAAVLFGVAVEYGAYLAQAEFAVAVDTSVIHAAQIIFAVVILGQALSDKKILLDLSQREHRATRNVLDRVIADNFDGVVVVDETGSVVMASEMAARVLEPGVDDGIAGLHMRDLLPEDIAGRIEETLRTGQAGQRNATRVQETLLRFEDERSILIEYVITISETDAVKAKRRGAVERVACLTFRDITARREAERRLTFLATHDPLTGAQSRVHFVDSIYALMGDKARRDNGMTVFLMNLSRFKAVNDSLGHSYGDAVLKQVVSRLKSCDVCCVARLGGDSFAMARPGVLSKAGISAFARSILDVVGQIYLVGEHRAIVGVKLGVADTAGSGYDPEKLISHADMALSTAREQPGNTFGVYAREMDVRVREIQQMEVALRQAIEENQLYVTYQPQIALSSGELVGVEALVRWDHPQLGPVPPSRFIPVAEETGIILDLGRWILHTACAEAVAWPRPIKLAVNFSPMQFEFGNVVEEVAHALQKTSLLAERLEVEITESMLISNPRLIIGHLEALGAMGAAIALDDFGTGYSSLSYLGRLPVDKIKVDHSFVRSLPEDQESGAIIRAIMTLSESLGKTVVAEGIENADQAWMLRLAGCHIGQGYHFGRSMRSAELATWMANLDQRAEAG